MSPSRDRWRQSSALSAGVVLVAILVGMINYLGFKYYARFDWTRSDLYSLSEKSLGLLESLDRDVEAIVFMSPEAPLYDPVMELLSRYEAVSPHFSIRVVDPVKNLLEAQELVDRFQLTQIDVVVFDRGDDRRIVESVDLADYDYSGLQYGQGPEMTGFKGEQVFTSSVLELLEARKLKVLFTVGHGELSLDEFSGRGLSQARDLLVQDNFELEEWASLGATEVPTDAALVVVAGPTSNFIEPELAALADYLESGGRMLVLLDPVLDDAGRTVRFGLEDVLIEYGIEVGSDIVVDPANPIPFYGPETIFVNSYGDHVVTRSLDQAAVPVILPLARSVSVGGEEPEDLTLIEILRTSSEGWGERSLDDLRRVERGEEDLPGPVSLGVAVSSTVTPSPEPLGETVVPAAVPEIEDGPEVRLMVIGDSDFVGNSQVINVGNTELLLSAVNWLAERETLIGIPPKKPDQIRLSLTGTQLRAAAWLVFGLLPGLSLGIGAMVFLRRRR